MLVACYGSLKKGHYNHRALGEDKKFLGEITVRGVMYSNGSYPKLYKVDYNQIEHEVERKPEEIAFQPYLSRDHVVEIYDVNEKAYNSITRMEVGAGYDAEQIETPYGEATIYWMPHENFSARDKWVEAYTDGKVNEHD